MPFEIAILQAKVNGFCDALHRIEEKDKQALPFKAFGEDYNNLRKLVLEAKPELKEVMPPEVPFGKNAANTPVTIAYFCEIDAYCQQIKRFLDA